MPGRLSTLTKLLAVAFALGLTVRALDSTQARRRLAARNPPRQAAPATPVSGPVVVRIVLGLKDQAPADWDGEIRLTDGKVRLSAPLGAEERIYGARWKLRSRRQGQQPVEPAVVTAGFDAPPAARVEAQTVHGSFGFALGELAIGRRASFLEGAAAVDRVPPVERLTSDGTDDDFPVAAAAGDGSIWCAYVAYRAGTPLALEEIKQGKFDSLVPRGNGDQVRLLQFDGKQWKAPLDVTEAGLDAWRPAVTVDGKGRVWVVWSQKSGEDWDLSARAYEPVTRRWSEVERVSAEPGADCNAVAAIGRSWPGPASLSSNDQSWTS